MSTAATTVTPRRAMPAPDRLDQARRHIEAHVFEPISLVELSAAAGLSPYHFTRQFTARLGVGPMAYLRHRRLAAAANRLCFDTAPSLIDLAFDCGFDSQEGFTRAFKRAFGVPPGQYRRSGLRATFQETSPMSENPTPETRLEQAAEPAVKPALRLAGVADVFTDMTKAGIPALWDRLMGRLPLAGQVGFETYGVCVADPQPGSMRYMAAVAVAADAAPEGVEIIEIPSRSYLVFRQVLHGGALHPQMQRAAREIWGERLPKSGYSLARSPDLEVYPDDFRPDKAGAWVEWWIPVEA